MKNKSNGFTLVELLLVLLITGYIMHSASQYYSKKIEMSNYETFAESEAVSMEVISTAIKHWGWANSEDFADDSLTEVNLNSNDFKSFLPSGDYSVSLPSGVALRAFVLMAPPFPGADPVDFPQVPKSVLILDT